MATSLRLFLLGGYDLEMLTIKQMLEGRDGCKVLDRFLGWGNARLSAYQEELALYPNSDIYGIELAEDIPAPGNYHRIDHHNDWSDKTSALEQVAAVLGVVLNRRQQLIAANDREYIPAMQALGATDEEISDIRRNDRIKEQNFEKASVGSYNLHEISIPQLTKEEYDAKKGLNLTLTDGVNTLSLDDVFVQDRRVGINRDIKTGKVEDSALFKQISYRFNNNNASYCFVFDAEVDDNAKLDDCNGQVVSVGGDNSQFVIGINKDKNTNGNIVSFDKALWLLSPTFLTRDEAKMAKFAITRLMPFRFLKSEMDKVKSYNVLSKELVRSERYELYVPGSIFYFESEDQKQDFAKKIEGKKEFRQIGYNEYK